jgi:hypothetical protein
MRAQIPLFGNLATVVNPCVDEDEKVEIDANQRHILAKTNTFNGYMLIIPRRAVEA